MTELQGRISVCISIHSDWEADKQLDVQKYNFIGDFQNNGLINKSLVIIDNYTLLKVPKFQRYHYHIYNFELYNNRL